MTGRSSTSRGLKNYRETVGVRAMLRYATTSVTMVLLTMTPSIVDAINRLGQLDSSESPSTMQKEFESGARSVSMGGSELSTEQATVHGKEDTVRAETVTDRKLLEENQTNPKAVNAETEPSLRNPAIGNPISHSQVIDLSRAMLSKQSSSYTLEKLLLGSRVYIPPPPPKAEPTSEYKALMKRLRSEAENRSYTLMTSRSAQKPETFSQRFPTASPAHAFTSTAAYMSTADAGDSDVTYADIDKQMAVVFNILLSIVACAAAIWMVARWWSTPTRLAISMGGACLVGIAECVVYWGYVRRVEEAKTTEGRLSEVREMVGTWVVGDGGNVKSEGGTYERVRVGSKEKLPDGVRERNKWRDPK